MQVPVRDEVGPAGLRGSQDTSVFWPALTEDEKRQLNEAPDFHTMAHVRRTLSAVWLKRGNSRKSPLYERPVSTPVHLSWFMAETRSRSPGRDDRVRLQYNGTRGSKP